MIKNKIRDYKTIFEDLEMLEYITNILRKTRTNKKEKVMQNKSFFEDLEFLDKMIRDLHKIDSKLLAGQFIPAYRENRRIISQLESIRNQAIVSESKEKSEHE